jgi:hypothetical protein
MDGEVRKSGSDWPAKLPGKHSNCRKQCIVSSPALPLEARLIRDCSSLWCGPNPRPGLTTFSWVAQNNVTSFNQDFSALVQALLNSGKLPSNIYLGVVGFGQEAFTAPDNVTFSVTNFDAIIDSSSASLSAVVSFSTKLLCIALFLSHIVFY